MWSKLSTQSLLQLLEDMTCIQCFKYLFTRQVNQDCLENLFSIIRQRGGFRDNPNAKQFKDTFRQVIVQSFVHPSTNANCEFDTRDVLLQLTNVMKIDSGLTVRQFVDKDG